MRMTALALAFVVFSPLMHSQEPRKQLFVFGGFMKAQAFLDMDKENQRSFAMGLVDGVFLAPFFDAPDHGKSLVQMHACVKDMSDVQVAAIIEKYLKDHPETWHLQLNVECLSALRSACPEQK